MQSSKTLVIRMLKELSEDLNNNNKKIQSEMKDTLIEIKNNLQGSNRRVGEVRIKSTILNIRMQKTTIRTRRRKENPKKRG